VYPDKMVNHLYCAKAMRNLKIEITNNAAKDLKAGMYGTANFL
jgi:hypothetical protein